MVKNINNESICIINTKYDIEEDMFLGNDVFLILDTV